MLSTNSSITSLRKSAERLSDKLTSMGFESEYDYFSCGPGGGQHYGQSYVTIDAEKGGIDVSLKVYADGYGTVKTWTEIKRTLMERIERADPQESNWICTGTGGW